MPASRTFADGARHLMVATLLLTAGSALAQASGSGGQTPKQPDANDPSLGLPQQPASMSKNPVAMSPEAARSEGTAPPDADRK